MIISLLFGKFVKRKASKDKRKTRVYYHSRDIYTEIG